MDDLSFKERLVYKMLIKGVNSDSLIGEISYASSRPIVLNSEQLLEKIMLESFANSDILKVYGYLRQGYMTEKQQELWRKVQDKVAFEYISSNIYEAPNILGEMDFIDVANTFKEVIKDKIDVGEINQESIDKIFDMSFMNFYESDYATPTISALKSKGKEDLFTYAVEKLRTILKDKVNSGNMSQEEKNIILNSIDQNINRYVRGGLDDASIREICFQCLYYEMYTGVVSLARVGSTEMSDLNVDQISKINIKNAKQVVEFAKGKYANSDDAFNAKDFYKLYLVFGKQRAMELIEGKYGDISLMQLQNFLPTINLNDYNIPQINAEPSYDKYQSSLINFLFASGPNDVNANMKKIIVGEITQKSFSLTRLINEYKLYYDFLGGNVTMDEVVKMMDNLELILHPDEKEINNTVKLFGIEHKDKISNTYKLMQQRVLCTIPKVKGSVGEYEYEMLDLVDPIQMNVGDITHCCFTFGGASESALMHSCTNEDSRIFVIKKNGEIVAQSWVWRNGNTICFDDIEIAGVSLKGVPEILNSYEQAAKEVIEISKNHEREGKKVQLATVGVKNSKIELKGKKLGETELILPKNRGIYTDADVEQVIIATSPDYEKPLEYEAEAIYQDERKKTMVVDPQQASQESIDKLNGHIDKINYSIDPENFKECDSVEDYTFVTYGFDWFVGITTSGEIVKRVYSVDERSKEEISNALQLISEKIKSGELTDNINDVMLDSMVKESATYGK